jgi:hypothetical protein
MSGRELIQCLLETAEHKGDSWLDGDVYLSVNESINPDDRSIQRVHSGRLLSITTATTDVRAIPGAIELNSGARTYGTGRHGDPRQHPAPASSAVSPDPARRQ